MHVCQNRLASKVRRQHRQELMMAAREAGQEEVRGTKDYQLIMCLRLCLAASYINVPYARISHSLTMSDG